MNIPSATYRLQFNSRFTFAAAEKIIPYLTELGVTDLYSSPVFQANQGSEHGYDVTDFAKINAELGGEQGLRAVSTRARAAGLGWLQDIVPNHMAYISENPYICEIFENGAGSRYARIFDFFNPRECESAEHQVLAPFLGKLYGQALRDHDILVRFGPSGFSVNYYEVKFPLLLESYARLLSRGIEKLEAALGRDNPSFLRYLATVESLVKMPEGGTVERRDLTRLAKRMLWDLYQQSPEVRNFIDSNVEDHNGRLGSESADLLDELLSEQVYRLSFWKVANEEINYRRFFNINSLICLRVEDDEVFDLVHALPLRLLREGVFSGLRVDHLDGLYDPKHYLRRVRDQFGDCYLVAEKILIPGEELPEYLPLHGTTGYDFGSALNRLFIPPENEEGMTRAYQNFTGEALSYPDLLHDKKIMVLMRQMVGNINNLAQLLKVISSRDPDGRDITPYSLRRAMVAVMSDFPVYRTYICPHFTNPGDRHYIIEAIESARKHYPDLLFELNFLEHFLLDAFQNKPDGPAKEETIEFVMRFQQFTGPLMATGVEDTAFYVYNRLLSSNEVGDDPALFGMTVPDFHDFVAHRANRWPHTMNLTMSHDSKRGEDFRARLNVLAEIPVDWSQALVRFQQLNDDKKIRVDGRPIPDHNDEYFIYQTLLGSFPFDGLDGWLERLKEYTVKAVREAKVYTAWLHPDLQYEEACTGFIERLLADTAAGGFMESFLPFQRRLGWYGMWNGLSQALLKTAAPGVPDFYQGSELWDFRLVDPDNRRPVDFEKRASSLYDIRDREREDLPGLIAELLRRPEDGRVKLFLIARSLRARKQHRELFTTGEYLPLVAAGRHAESVVAFARRRQDQVSICAAPRLLTRVVTEGGIPIGETWQDTRLTMPQDFPRRFTDAVSGREIQANGGLSVADVFAAFPAAMLISNGG